MEKFTPPDIANLRADFASVSVLAITLIKSIRVRRYADKVCDAIRTKKYQGKTKEKKASQAEISLFPSSLQRKLE